MNNLHDKLFKQMMSLKSEAIALATSFFPKDVLDEIDLDTFELSNVSFINEQLEEYFADIVYTCNTKGNAQIKISFLLEHKSYYDPHLPLQLLRYLLEAYDYQYVKEGKKELSLVIPVLIYHGEGEWKKREIADMIPLSNVTLKKYSPNFSYDLIDLVRTTDDYLKNMKVGHLLPATFMLFKHKGDKEYFLQNMKEILIFVRRTVTEEERRLFIESLRTYIFGLFKASKQEIMAYDSMLKEVIEEKLYLPGSAMDMMLKEGRVEGRVEGRIEGKVEGKVEGRVEGKVEGRVEERLLKNIAFSLGLLKSLPHLSNLQIATLSKAKEKFVADIREIVTKNIAAKSKKMILAKFFKGVKLEEKEKKEILRDIDNYYKKD